MVSTFSDRCSLPSHQTPDFEPNPSRLQKGFGKRKLTSEGTNMYREKRKKRKRRKRLKGMNILRYRIRELTRVVCDFNQ